MTDLMKYIDPDLGDVGDKKMKNLLEGNAKKQELAAAASQEPSGDKELERDFRIARQNLEDIAEKAKEAIEEAMSLAKSTEHPRPWEVVGQLLNHAANISEQLVSLHDKKNKAKKSGQTQGEEGGNTINNPVQNNYYMSTKELADLLGNKKGA